MAFKHTSIGGELDFYRGGINDPDALPKSYKPKIIAVPANPNNSFNGTPTLTVFPAVPQGAITPDILSPDGHSHCFLYPSAYQQLVAMHGGYPQRIKQPPHRIPRHGVGVSGVHTPGGGLGLFATQDLKQGDLIFSERALFILPEGATRSVPAYFTKKQALLAELKHTEMELEIAHERLMGEDKEAYMALWNAHEGKEGMGPLTGRWRTNGIALNGLVDAADEYSGIFKVASRFNHSCCPSVSRTWNRCTFAMEFRAARTIQNGEELSISYVPLMLPQHQRQSIIDAAGYGFRCACRACCSGIDAHETIKRDGDPKKWFLVVALISMAANGEIGGNTGGFREDWVVGRSGSIEVIELIEKEGLELAPQYEAHLAFLVNVYCAMGNARKGLVWLRKLDAIRRVQNGGEEKSVRELQDTVKAHRMWDRAIRVRTVLAYVGVV